MAISSETEGADITSQERPVMPLTRKKILDTVKRAQLYHDENDKMRKDLPSWLAAFAELMYNQGIEDATKIFVGNPNYAKKPVKKDQ